MTGVCAWRNSVEGGKPVMEELCQNEGGDKLDELVALSVVNTGWTLGEIGRDE